MSHASSLTGFAAGAEKAGDSAIGETAEIRN